MNHVKDEMEVIVKLLFVTMITVLLIYIVIETGTNENLIDKIDEMCTVLNLSEKICEELDLD